MAFQVTASLLQPVVGYVHRQAADALFAAAGMGCSLVGLILLATAHTYIMLLVGAICIGLGSAIFHPESSRVARLASGGRYGLAQSTFQVGGNAGSAMGPLLAAFIVVPFGQGSVGWFALGALVGIVVLARVGAWYSAHLKTAHLRKASVSLFTGLPRRKVLIALVHPGAAHLHQEHLHGEPVELLHLLRDREVRRFGAGFAADALPVPRRVGGGHPARRRLRRPLRAEDRDLVLDPRRCCRSRWRCPMPTCSGRTCWSC